MEKGFTGLDFVSCTTLGLASNLQDAQLQFEAKEKLTEIIRSKNIAVIMLGR